MESVYQTGNRSWVSEKICLKDLFREFSAAVPTVSNIESESAKSRKAVDLKKISVLMDVELSEDKLKILADTCSVDKLKVSCEPPTVDVECVKARPGLFDKSDIPPEASNLETLKHLKKRIINDETVEHLKYRSNIWLTEPSVENLDLTPGKHFLVTVRMYHPFRHKIGIRSSQPPRCSQEIVLLGEQFLTSLRDKILCPSDLAVSGELSENPHQSFTVRAMDIYKSGFIFIENTFYNDHRDPKNIDYSSVIRNWAASHDLGPFQTARMEDTKFEDLTVRLGYPYVYQHQGNCEHLLVFSDVR
ncbi:hypothetical protein ANN_15341 [Periplaneta americana]|uniref:snRNA-activating protein complex subunit 3 n=2 Tax=Periplaneta americana TaxID=6978 RepID=A0ABQ8SGS6_PERAM|nr:hypothetical protein ANN_15341 [Periplaneta americana]